MKYISSKNKEGSFLYSCDSNFKFISEEIESKYKGDPSLQINESKLMDILNDILDDLKQILGVKETFSKIIIYKVRFGTGTSLSPAKDLDSSISLTIREGCGYSNIVGAVIDSLTHINNKKINLTGTERRCVRDWLIVNTRLNKTFKKYALNYVPITSYSKKHLTDRFQKMDRRYVNSLGLFPELMDVSINDDSIYFSNKELTNLTSNEKLLLNELIKNKNEIVSYDNLLDILESGSKIVSYYAVYKCVERLRKKLTTNGISKSVLKTVPKQGVYLKLS